MTNGGKQAIYEAFAAILDPGDEVIVPAPYWTTYPESIRLAGGVPVEVVADETTGYRVSVEQLEAARTERTKVLLFVSPSNPTGAVYSPADTEAIGRWAVEHGLWVMTDEIYEHLVYGDAVFTSLPGGGAGAARPVRRRQRGGEDLRDDRLAAWAGSSAPRTSSRPPPTCSRTPRPMSPMSRRPRRSPRVSGDLTAVAEMRAAFDRRRRTIVRMLNEIDGVVCPEPEGAFYAYPSVKALLGKEIRGSRPADLGRAGRADPGRGRGRGRPGRGLRHAGLSAALVRARRRGPGRGRRPDPEAAGRGQGLIVAARSARMADNGPPASAGGPLRPGIARRSVSAVARAPVRFVQVPPEGHEGPRNFVRFSVRKDTR